MSRHSKAIRRPQTILFITVVLGLFFASFYISHREPPLVRIGEIKPGMNFSKVRVQGVLESNARRMGDGSVLYMIVDETGALPVFLNHVPEGKLPTAGCAISATGQLGMDANKLASMRVHGSAQIKVLKKPDPITVSGRISKLWTPPPDSRAPHRIILDRPEGSLEVVHWFTPKRQPAVGDRVKAKGVLGFYKGRMQLKVREAADIRLQSER